MAIVATTLHHVGVPREKRLLPPTAIHRTFRDGKTIDVSTQTYRRTGTMGVEYGIEARAARYVVYVKRP